MVVLGQTILLRENVGMQNCEMFVRKAVAYPVDGAEIHDQYCGS
jgi:hypothetical protein